MEFILEGEKMGRHVSSPSKLTLSFHSCSVNICGMESLNTPSLGGILTSFKENRGHSHNALTCIRGAEPTAATLGSEED